MFQFLIGKIVSRRAYGVFHTSRPFQFLIGKIVSGG